MVDEREVRLVTGAAVAATIGGFRFRFADEDALQEAIAAVLTDVGFTPKREVRLDARCRIDLLVDRVGVEVKVGGAAGDVVSQLTRYAAFDAIEELVLVTTRPRHKVPAFIAGKPCHMVMLGAQAL